MEVSGKVEVVVRNRVIEIEVLEGLRYWQGPFESLSG